jgi:hypothetical protein
VVFSFSFSFFVFLFSIFFCFYLTFSFFVFIFFFDAGGLAPLIPAWPRVAVEIDRGACCHAEAGANPMLRPPNSLCLHVSWYGPGLVHGFHFSGHNSRFIVVFSGFLLFVVFYFFVF